MQQTGAWRVAYWPAAILLLPIMLVAKAKGDILTLYQVQTQDLPILLALPVALAVAARWAPSWRLPQRIPSPRILIVAGIALTLLLGWGAHMLMGDFPISRDEEMVVFDMAVFEKGRLAAPLAIQWRAYAEALVPDFLLNADNPSGLVSDYLPVNAMLRLAFSRVADPAFFNPLLTLIGGAALYDIARRQFCDDRGALWVVLLIYALSAQILVTAMTTYAMTGHMALNMVWLAAFLRGGKAGHAVAIGIGFLSVGLHQLVFHPLFVAPFMLWRLQRGEWRIVLAYAIAYAAILGWWITYPRIATLETGVPMIGSGATDDFFTEKVLPLLLHRYPNTLSLMMLNLLRFVAWQNLALIPLFVSAVPLAWRSRSIAAPLLWGIGGLLLLVTVVLPYQGHGWGYRYLHPFLGSFALLAGFGYQRLAAQVGDKADGMVIVLSGLTLIAAVPLLLTRTYGFVAPHIALERYIAAQKGDFILIDSDAIASGDGRWNANAIDHVRNLPNLSNRPLRFSSRGMNVEMTAELCRRGTVVLITRDDMHRVGFGASTPLRSPRFNRMIAQAHRAYPNCLHAAR